MNYSLSGWLRESPEVSHAKKEVVGPFFHIHHYIDILQRDKVQQGTCGQGQQLCCKKPLTMRFSADLRDSSGRFGVLLGGVIDTLFLQILDLENISEHCAEIHITETQITGINDAKNTEKRVAHANGV